MVAGLTFQEIPGYVQPDPRRTPKTEYTKGFDDGSHDVLWSYICSAMTMICCLPFNIGGWVYANRAASKGNPRAKGAKIFAAIMLIIWIISTPIEVAAFRQIYDFFMKSIGDSGG